MNNKYIKNQLIFLSKLLIEQMLIIFLSRILNNSHKYYISLNIQK